MARINFQQFGMDFLKLIFTESRLKKELDKSFVREVPIHTSEAVGSAKIGECSIKHLPNEGNPASERVFDVYIPFSMYLRINVLLGQEKYKVNGHVRMRLWLEAHTPLVIYLNGFKVPPKEVQLTATGDGNWLNLDLAKKAGMEDKLKESMATQFSDEFNKSQKSRIINILEMVK